MPGSFAALIPRGVWNMDSPNFAGTAFSEVRSTLAAQKQQQISLFGGCAAYNKPCMMP
jgi:hypothetical protein